MKTPRIQQFSVLQVFVLTVVTSLLVALYSTVASAAPPIHWDAPVKWTPWEQAMVKAKAENKPICLVVYADWCPKCRKIAPFFKKAELLAASEKAVMVLQNEDEGADWLANEFAASGKYVPRIFFLDKGGNIDHGINSGNERFPFFYRPNDAGVSKLVRAIDAAVTKVGGPVAAAVPQIPAAAPTAGVNAVAVAPVAPAPPVEEQSDIPMMIGLVVFAIGAVWVVGRGNG